MSLIQLPADMSRKVAGDANTGALAPVTHEGVLGGNSGLLPLAGPNPAVQAFSFFLFFMSLFLFSFYFQIER